MSSRSGQNVDIVWTENSLLITATGEHMVRLVFIHSLYTQPFLMGNLSNNLPLKLFRLWDLERDDNYVLSLDETLGFEKGEMINCVSHCPGKGNCVVVFPFYHALYQICKNPNLLCTLTQHC